MTSNHYSADRTTRQDLINQIGIGHKVNSFVVDRKHRDGAEIHVVTSTGLIVVYNKESHKMVTVLIARPQQINRYYIECGNEAPAQLLEIAKEHMKLGYNNY